MIPEAARKHIYYEEKDIVLLHGDCLKILPLFEPDSVDLVLTDPPYGLNFMGKEWDHGVPGKPFWQAVEAVSKPGAMLMAFGGTRTHHRLMSAIEDAGWEIRDSGFPKSLDISKAIDKAAGVEFQMKPAKGVGFMNAEGRGGYNVTKNQMERIGNQSPDAERWDGWGTALKPAWEPIILAMKSLDGTFANNALKHGVAGLNINAGRIGTEDKLSFGSRKLGDGVKYGECIPTTEGVQNSQGRFPANLMLDEDTAEMLDEQSGESMSKKTEANNKGTIWGSGNDLIDLRGHNDSGGASRFFYVAKAANKDRGNTEDVDMSLFNDKIEGVKNTHPTVKPTDLMHKLIALNKYLLKLCSQPVNEITFDPFGGSGTTAVACKQSGRKCIIIDEKSIYLDIAVERLKKELSFNA